MDRYKAITGRSFNLADLSEAERAALDEVMDLYRTKPSWQAFKRGWPDLVRSSLGWKRMRTKHTLYRVCQDLASRLGIAEKRVAAPDYRARILDLIEERYRSRYAFCKAYNIDQSHLSRVLAGKRHLSPESFFDILRALDVEIELVDRDEVASSARFSSPGPLDPCERLRLLDRRIGILRNLRARAERSPVEERSALLEVEPTLFVEDDELAEARQRVQTGEDFDAVLSDLLAHACEEKALLGEEITAEAREVSAASRRVG